MASLCNTTSVRFIHVLASVITLLAFLLLLSILLHENIATYVVIPLLIDLGILLVWGSYKSRCCEHSRMYLWWAYVLCSLGSVSGNAMDRSSVGVRLAVGYKSRGVLRFGGFP